MYPVLIIEHAGSIGLPVLYGPKQEPVITSSGRGFKTSARES